MYPTLRGGPLTPPGVADSAATGPSRGRVGGTVVALGAVSLLTDISSEMVNAVLPIYLTLALGFTPLAFGVIDGIYQGATVFVRLAGGYVADRFHRPKAVCQVGYGLSAVMKLGLIGAGGAAGPLGVVVAVDRIGKGIRTAPRDALIAGSVDHAILGRAFGVHRAMDTTGAMLGPLVAFAILVLLPGDYDTVFLTSFVVALLGCAVLWAFVSERRHPPSGAPGPNPSDTPGDTAVAGRDIRGLLGDPRFRIVAIVAGTLGLLTVSDGFLYLGLRDLGAVSARYFPLLFLGTAAVYLALAVPVGRLADRAGRTRVFVAGHLALLGGYLLLLGAARLPDALTVAGVVTLLGVYYAATDGVLAAVAAGLTPEPLRATGIAVVQTAVAVGRLLSAVLFGLLWTVSTQQRALVVFAAALALALPAAAVALRRGERAGAGRG